MGALQTIDGPVDPDQPRNPAALGWPATLVVELALKTATPQELKDEYGYGDEEWATLRHDPAFLADLAQAMEMVKREGMSFKLKARLQADELLSSAWRLIHNGDTPATVRADLIKSVVRWAGYDNKEAAAGATANAFQININLN